MKKFLIFLVLLQPFLVGAQEDIREILGFSEYMAFVKQYHPVVRQANLHLEKGEAELLRARGAFDPKLEVDYATKQFKGTEYYELLNSAFKVPTWYGLEFKAGFEQNEGVHLNPERKVPPEGLFNAGVSLSAGQGLLIDKRRAALRSAKALRNQTAAERELLVNEVLFEAAVEYLEWTKLYLELQIYRDFVVNARERFAGIRQNALLGEIAAIDTVEAKIVFQDRELQMEQTRMKLIKQQLEVSNFLWLEHEIPVEIRSQFVPDPGILDEVDVAAVALLEDFSLEDHPKLEALKYKLAALRIEKKLKANNLLPKIELQYNLITPEPDVIGTYDTSNYKAGLNFSFPLFLRKERGELKLAQLKLEDIFLETELTRREIENKVAAILQELESYQRQILLLEEMVENYEQMLRAEERKFEFGESSLFLVNSRENKLIEVRLKQTELLTKFLVARAEFHRSLGIIPEAED